MFPLRTPGKRGTVKDDVSFIDMLNSLLYRSLLDMSSSLSRFTVEPKINLP